MRRRPGFVIAVRGNMLLLLAILPALLLLAPSCVPVTGGDGDGDNGGDDTPVAGLPLQNYETTNFMGPARCADCHAELADEAGADVSMATHWRATMMANAAHDPYFRASVEAEVNHAPELAAIIERTCAACHTPVAHTQALAAGGTSALLGDGFFDSGNGLHAPAMDGVSCSVCHQITDAFLADPEASFSGGYVIDTDTPRPDRAIYGPYPEPQLPGLMQGSVGYTPVFGAHIEASGLCATCHTLFTPVLDGSGTPTGDTFPEQTPFLEWQASTFGDGDNDDRNCQSCHMPVADGAVPISRIPNTLEGRQPFYQHLFLGGNVFMLKLLGANIEDLGLTASSDNFDAQIERTQAFLSTSTADVSIPSASLAGGTLAVDVRITNKTGHKFPTSFPSRRAWLHLTVTDGAGAVVFESGAWDSNGRIVGDDEDTDATTFEAHYDQITAADQVQVYQTIMGNTDGDVTFTLLRAAAYLKDNRLLPSGFDKTAAPEAIAVHGAAMADGDFVGGGDEVTYSIDVGGASGPFHVSVELLYQSVAYPFAHDLREMSGTHIDQFNTMFDAADKTPSLIDAAETSVP